MDLITITQEKDSTFKTEIRNHSILSDMAVSDGGKDDAPSPAEFLVSSLGNCIAMVINTYCESHGYENDDLCVTMTYLLNDKPKMIKSITCDIEISEKPSVIDDSVRNKKTSPEESEETLVKKNNGLPDKPVANEIIFNYDDAEIININNHKTINKEELL